jgi:hypothetical protein
LGNSPIKPVGNLLDRRHIAINGLGYELRGDAVELGLALHASVSRSLYGKP